MRGKINAKKGTPAEEYAAAMVNELMRYDPQRELYYCNIEPCKGKDVDVLTRSYVQTFGAERAWASVKQAHYERYHEFELRTVEATRTRPR